MPLPIREGLKAGESLQGCALRHAELNMYDNMHWIAGLAGTETWSAQSIVGLAQHADALSSLLDIAAADLRRAGYIRTNPNGVKVVSFGDQTFYRTLLDFKGASVCPHCLVESGHARQFWDLALAVACPEHGVYLVDSCPDCGCALKWRRGHVCMCDCGFDLRTAEAMPANDETRLVMTFLREAAEPIPGNVSKDISHPRDLPKLGLQALTDVMCMLWSWINMRGFVRSRNLPTMSQADRRRLCSGVGDVLGRWPVGWHEAIKRLADNRAAGRYNAFGMQQIFGKHYIRLVDPKMKRPFAMLKKELERFISEDGLGRSCSACNSKLAVISNAAAIAERFATADETQRELRIGHDVFCWLRDTGRLTVERRRRARSFVSLVLRSSIDDARIFLERLCGTTDAAQKLGVSRALVERFAAAGLIPVVRGRTVDGYRNWLFNSDELDAFASQLSRSAKTTCQGIDPTHRTFNAAVTGLRTFGVSAITLLQAVLDGTLAAYTLVPKIRHLDDLYFRHADLIAFGRTEQMAPSLSRAA